jgi:hypothetical protein
LAIELLRSGATFDSAVELATCREKDYVATTIIHRQIRSGAPSIIFAADLPAHKRALKNDETSSAAERAIAGQLARLAQLLGDEVSSAQAIRSELASVRYRLRERKKDNA